ncbi:MAG: oligosaccharide flippase family protein, partial [Rubrivivax sp.]
MTAPRSPARNMVWNVAGQVAPIVVALLAVPLLLHQVGVQRFGFISLAWALIGYAGLFDFGLGRALTRVVAQELGRGDRDMAVRAGRTGTWLMLLFGTVIGAALLATAPLLVDRLLQMPPELRDEAAAALRVLALSLPVVLLTTALRGVLEAVQAFPRLNLIRMLMGLLSYLGPLLCALVWPRLEAVVAAVVVMRVFGAWMHLRACRVEFAAMLRLAWPERSLLKALFAVGGWISVSNFVSPLLSYLDRFIVARQLPIEQVAYYATPYDLLMRTMVLPYALMAVIFPLLASRAGQPQALQRLYGSSVRLLWVLMWPLCFTAMVLAEPLLGLWLGADFARAGAAVVPALAFGLFVNTLAQAPANLIQASGSPRRMALLHLAELPVFLLALWHLVAAYGIRGAALAWAGRMAVDAAV